MEAPCQPELIWIASPTRKTENHTVRAADCPLVVIADFDETIVYENTLLPLFDRLSAISMAMVVIRAITRGRWLSIGPHKAIKEEMYRVILAQVGVTELTYIAQELAEKVSVNSWAMAAIQREMSSATIVELVVASASLAEVVRAILESKEIRFHRLIGSDPEEKSGIYTGRLLDGECVGKEKAVRVKRLLQTYYKGWRVVAIGNYPADTPLFELAETSFVVKGSNVTPYLEHSWSNNRPEGGTK